MKKFLFITLICIGIVSGQGIIWERNIQLDWESYEFKGIDTDSGSNIHIGIQDNPLKDPKFSYGDSWVYSFTSNGSILQEKNFGDVFNDGFRDITGVGNKFCIAGNSSGISTPYTDIVMLTSDPNGNSIDSLRISQTYDALWSIQIKQAKNNGVIHQYVYQNVWKSTYSHGYLSVLDSTLDQTHYYNYSNDVFKDNRFGQLPDSIINYYEYIDAHLPSGSGFTDFVQTDDGMIFSGRLGGWTNSLYYRYLKYVSDTEGVKWETYYPEYQSEYFQNGRLTIFRDFAVSSDQNTFLATVWRDEDEDLDEDEGELFIACLETDTGKIIWTSSVTELPDQILSSGEFYLIRYGTKVQKVQDTGSEMDIVWETDFENTAQITAAPGGYISASIIFDELNVFRYYESTGIEDTSPLTKRSQLSQNYPNPFNPVTEISYSVHEAAEIKLSVYNISGRLIETLVDSGKEQGNYAVPFNAEDLNSGIYLYKLSINGHIEDTKRMLLIK